MIAGSPPTVRAEIERQVAELGVNYLLTYLFLGTMSLADALRSLQLFSVEVMPHLAKLNRHSGAERSEEPGIHNHCHCRMALSLFLEIVVMDSGSPLRGARNDGIYFPPSSGGRC